MILALKILITVTFLFQNMRAWTGAVVMGTAAVLADHDVKVGPATRKKNHDSTGKATLKAIVSTFWLIPLTVLVWVFL